MLTQPRMRTGRRNEAVSLLAVFHIAGAGDGSRGCFIRRLVWFTNRAEAGACRLSVMVIAAASQGLPG